MAVEFTANFNNSDDNSTSGSSSICDTSVPLTIDPLVLKVNPHLEVIDEKYAKC